jgi:hypothetical protein
LLIKQGDPKLKRRLSILQTRFETNIIFGIRVNWCKPFSNEFCLLNNIERYNVEDLAKLITDSVVSHVSRGDIQAITTEWVNLADDIMACLIADLDLAPFIRCLAGACGVL